MHAMRCPFIALFDNKASTTDDVLDTREAMVIEAQKALTASFVEYETNSNNVENVCADVGGEKYHLCRICVCPTVNTSLGNIETQEKRWA